MNTYPYTCPYNKEPETRVRQNGTIRPCGFPSQAEHDAVNHAEDDLWSTNKNMYNGENSDSRRYCPRCRHFETETVETQNLRQFRIEVHCNMY